jgi:hypothetical protein
VAHALALIAAIVSTAALAVVVFLTALVVRLAFKASRASEARKRTQDL